MRRRVFAFIVCAALAIVIRQPAAWGPVAHRAVAEIAQQRLTPDVAQAVEALLAGETMADVAVWADTVRQTTHPQTYNWHFVNVAIDSSGYDPARHCRATPQGDCILKALPRVEHTLRDPSAPARGEALRFLIHLVGDLHQPLHVGDNHDRGGNDRRISSIGGARNLHAAWDSGIINASNGSTTSLVNAANAWLATQDEAEIAGGEYLDWANESWRISRDIAYRHVADNSISRDERLEAMRIIEKRVARAGVRLAEVLNRALAAPSVVR